MPVTTQRIEPHVYLTTYSESPLIKQMLDAVAYRKTIADNYEEVYFVSIVDLTRFGTMPYDVSSVRRAVAHDNRNLRTLAIGAPLYVRALMETFRSLLGLKMEFYETREEALERARCLLERKRETTQDGFCSR